MPDINRTVTVPSSLVAAPAAANVGKLVAPSGGYVTHDAVEVTSDNRLFVSARWPLLSDDRIHPERLPSDAVWIKMREDGRVDIYVNKGFKVVSRYQGNDGTNYLSVANVFEGKVLGKGYKLIASADGQALGAGEA